MRILKKRFAVLMVILFLAGLAGTEAMAMGKLPHRKKGTGTTATSTTKTKKAPVKSTP